MDMLWKHQDKIFYLVNVNFEIWVSHCNFMSYP